MNSIKIFTGTIAHCDNVLSLQVIREGFLIVGDSKILAIGNSKDLESCKEQLKIPCKSLTIALKNTQILIPGLIDTHIHAPQYPNIGLGYDKPLLEWLDTYTYNIESKYCDLDYSKKVYEAVVKKTLSFGTTTACYFGSVFRQSTLTLVDSAIKFGQRALIGKINMTKLAPDCVLESSDESLQETEIFIKEVLARKSTLVKPIVTPRFAISVDMPLMKKLSELAKRYDCHIQSHISENCAEVSFVKELYDGKQYADVYDEGNLLTEKTIMAHAVHLTDSELGVLSQKGTSVAHCPSSNTRLHSGSCDVRRLMEYGISVGLGTDVSGGCSASIIDAMRSAIDTSIHLSYQKKNNKPLNYIDAFYLATLGGAKALALENTVGNFEVGKDFDALVVDMDVEGSSCDYLSDCDSYELLQKFVYVGDDRNVVQVFVAGNRVK